MTPLRQQKNPDPDSCNRSRGFRRVVSTSYFFSFVSAPLKVLTIAAMSPSWVSYVWLEVGDDRFNSSEIQRLYEAKDYPLPKPE